ncbi:MAG: sulfite exporter TauE/SafE family protein, partial [Candidatus Aminicenantaceae bacterium]
VIYGTLKRWSPEAFRATLQGFLFPTSLFILMGHALAGLWTGPVLRMYLYSLPLVLVAVYLGGRINRAFSTERFSKWVHVLLIALGFLLLGEILA